MQNKFFLTITALILFAASAQLHSQNLFKDDFNYPVIDSLQGIGGWYQSGLNTPYNVQIKSPGLVYPGYAGSGIGNMIYLSNTAEGDIVYHNFTSQNTGRLYMSYMLRVDSLTATATNGGCVGFNPTSPTFNNSMVYIKKVSSTTFNLGIRKSKTIHYDGNVYNTNTTYLIVVKYSFVSGDNNDSTKMFVFSSGVPSSEPAIPGAFATDSLDPANQGSVYITNNYAQGSSMDGSSVKVDGIRIGLSWATSVLADVKLLSANVPDSYRLEQNYPNPFNPVTSIRFSVPEKSLVKIDVHDASGKLITELVNSEMNSGTYSVTFSGGGLSSGTYFCRFSYGNQRVSGNAILKMILVK